MPITVRHEGSNWVVEYRRHVVAAAATEAEAEALARRAMHRLLAQADTAELRA